MATCIAVCFLIALPLAAQDARKVEEPEYVNSAFRLDANAALTPLERQTGHPVTKPQGLGHVASKVLVFPGDRSPVRFTAGDNLEFVVRVERRDVDPQTSIQFYILKPAKGKRELIVVKAGSMGISSKSTIGESALAFEATKYGEFSFKIRSISALPPGEYTISTSTSRDGYCFGVDASK